jgi:outer membrane protein TolC
MDELEQQAEVVQAEYTDLEVRNSLDTQKEQLNLLLGRDIETGFAVEEVPPPAPEETSLEAVREKALALRPELREARLAVEQAEANRRVAQAGYIPEVSLTLTQVRLYNIDFAPTNVTSAGLMVKWNVFDWGGRHHEVAAAAKTLDQARNSQIETAMQVLVDVGAKFRQLQQSRLALRAAELRLAAEREKLRVTMNSFEADFTLRKDMLQQKASADEAGSRHQQALLGVWTAKAELESAIGIDQP